MEGGNDHATTTDQKGDNIDMYEDFSRLSVGSNTRSWKKSRLLVGEDDFSFTAALRKKHAFKEETIVATELRGSDELIEKYRMRRIEFEDLLRRLEELRVQLQFGVNAENLHVHFNKRFHRIYFNFPYTTKRVEADKASDTAPMLGMFFQSARDTRGR